MSVGLTPRQADVLRHIQGVQATESRAPTYQQISDAVGLNNRGHAHTIVSRLVERGAVERRAEGIVVLNPIPICLACCGVCARLRDPDDCEWIDMPGAPKGGRLVCSDCRERAAA